jgi:hypothetical protein
MEESDVCTVPGGLAKMKRQFEKDKMTSTCNAFSEYQYRHESRAEQVTPLRVICKQLRVEFCFHQCRNTPSLVIE